MKIGRDKLFRAKPRLLLLLAVTSIVILAIQAPPVKASGGLTIDGTGSACATSTINATILQGKGCGPSDFGIPLCASHPGGFCPLGDLVILQILLNNTGTVTKVVGNQGLDQWHRRTSVLNGQGGKMEEWYSTTTQPISNPAIYITETMSAITIAAQEFAISGYDSDAPFDPNSTVPFNATGTGNTISGIISTSHPRDLILGLEYGGGGTISAGPEFTGVCLNVSPCQFTGIAVDASESLTTAVARSDLSVSMTQTTGASWGLIVDAVKPSSPAVLSIIPERGAVGSTITITGISLNDTTDVRFCGILQPSFILVNDTLITTIAPQLPNPPSTQTCDITVTTLDGSSATVSGDRFSFLPSVVSITPTSGGVGTLVTITGTGFIGATSVSICGVPQPRISVTNDTQIVATVPGIGLTASTKCTISVTNPNGVSTSPQTNSFVFLPQSRAAPTSVPPLLSGNLPLFIGLILGAIALLSGSRLVQKRDPTDYSKGHEPNPPTIRT